LFRYAHQHVDRDAFDAGHRGHGLLDLRPFDNKYGVNQIVAGEDIFAHQTAGKIIAAHAPRAEMWKDAHVFGPFI